jgi:hypothetical protein
MNAISYKHHWDDHYPIGPQDFDAFWTRQLRPNEDCVLYVLGRGFDPRMCAGLARIQEVAPSVSLDVLLIEYDEGEHSASAHHAGAAKQNEVRLGELRSGVQNFISYNMPMWSNGGSPRQRIGSVRAAMALSKVDLAQYDHVIVDVSAMPRSVYFPIIGRALSAAQAFSAPTGPAVFVLVCESPTLDAAITDEEPDEAASFIHGFGSLLDADRDLPMLWLPILGEHQHAQMERIHALIGPDEIYPLLPFPAVEPRRCDALIREYHKLLFDSWRVEPRDMIHVSENNPFEVYRRICRTVEACNTVLEPLGGCQTAVSALSSKLLSIGALLAAYELKASRYRICVPHVEAQGYSISASYTPAVEAEVDWQPFSLWLEGPLH